MRNGIIAGILLVVIAVVGYGVLYSSGVTETDAVAEGEHYFALDQPAKTDPIQVVEYFAYSCIHCWNLDPLIEDWKDSLPEGVVFKRKHVGFSPLFQMFSRTHLTLEQHGALEQNHKRIFRAIHERNKQFISGEMMADFVDGYGIDRETFISTFDGRRVTTMASRYDSEFRRYGLTGTPALVVADKYVMNMSIGRAQALQAVDELVAQLLSDEAAGTTGTE